MALLRNLLTKLNVVVKHNNVIGSTNNVSFIKSNVLQRFYSTVPTPYEIVDQKKPEKDSKEVIKNVNDLVNHKKEGRLFAVVHLAGKQFKITPGDVIVVEGYWPPTAGDKLNLDKVLLVGSKDFSLIGTPLVQHGLVNVLATVVEKTLSHTKTHFRKKRRKQYKRIHFYKQQYTMLRINEISINGEVNKPPDVTGLKYAVF